MYASAVAGWLLDVQLTDFLIKFRELRPSLGAPGGEGRGEGISTTEGVNKVITSTKFGKGLFAKNLTRSFKPSINKCLY